MTPNISVEIIKHACRDHKKALPESFICSHDTVSGICFIIMTYGKEKKNNLMSHTQSELHFNIRATIYSSGNKWRQEDQARSTKSPCKRKVFTVILVNSSILITGHNHNI